MSFPGNISFKDDSTAIINHRVKTVLWLTLSALIFLPPFTINNFIQGRIVVGVMAVAVVTVLMLQAWTIYKHRYQPGLTLLGLIPAIIIFLMTAIYYQGIIGALWCYPAILVFFFILPRAKAILVSALLLALAIPNAWIQLDFSLAVRVAVTLTAVTIFSGIFVAIIENQKNELFNKELLRRDSMVSASHELRTPLATAMAQVEAIKDGIRPLEQNQILSLGRSIEHLNNLVEDLYILSLSDTGELNCYQEQVLLAPVMDDALTSVKEKLQERSLAVNAHIAPDLSILADPQRIRQIIDNLLENCCRYTRGGGLITVRASLQKRCTELVISDNGPGVKSAKLNMLFERFYREDNSRSRIYGGTGLGLSLVKALVEAQGGKVSAFTSDEGGLGIKIRFYCS